MIELDRCRVCGCTEEEACPGGCHWLIPGLCSQCDELFLLVDHAGGAVVDAAAAFQQAVALSAAPATVRRSRAELFAAVARLERLRGEIAGEVEARRGQVAA